MDDWKEAFIRANHQEMSVPDMAKALDVSKPTVYNYCHNNKLPIKKVRSNWRGPYKPKENKVFVHKAMPEPEPVRDVRAPAVYSNRSPYGLATELMNLNVK
jgi:excisionase family DNA binding protein